MRFSFLFPPPLPPPTTTTTTTTNNHDDDDDDDNTTTCVYKQTKDKKRQKHKEKKGKKMSNQFIQRLVNYVANEIIIKGLANSRTFQRFAVRTNKQYEDMTKQGMEHIQKATAESASTTTTTASASAGTSSASAQSTTLLSKPSPPLRGIPGFVAAFFKEIRKDITGS